MSGQPLPALHARTHLPGGSDPMPSNVFNPVCRGVNDGGWSVTSSGVNVPIVWDEFFTTEGLDGDPDFELGTDDDDIIVHRAGTYLVIASVQMALGTGGACKMAFAITEADGSPTHNIPDNSVTGDSSRTYEDSGNEYWNRTSLQGIFQNDYEFTPLGMRVVVNLSLLDSADRSASLANIAIVRLSELYVPGADLAAAGMF